MKVHSKPGNIGGTGASTLELSELADCPAVVVLLHLSHKMLPFPFSKLMSPQPSPPPTLTSIDLNHRMLGLKGLIRSYVSATEKISLTILSIVALPVTLTSSLYFLCNINSIQNDFVSLYIISLPSLEPRFHDSRDLSCYGVLYSLTPPCCPAHTTCSVNIY